MDDDRDCIAFFDSGIGGLTLLRECAANLPDEKFVYLGDNARAPYGNKSAEEIKTLTAQAFAYPLPAQSRRRGLQYGHGGLYRISAGTI